MFPIYLQFRQEIIKVFERFRFFSGEKQKQQQKQSGKQINKKRKPKQKLMKQNRTKQRKARQSKAKQSKVKKSKARQHKTKQKQNENKSKNGTQCGLFLMSQVLTSGHHLSEQLKILCKPHKVHFHRINIFLDDLCMTHDHEL